MWPEKGQMSHSSFLAQAGSGKTAMEALVNIGVAKER